MNIHFNDNNQEEWGKFSSLKKSVDKAKKAALKKRIAKKPHVTDLEYLLGAFIQMYDPHLEEFIQKLSEKGYAIDASSGFGGKNSEFQVMTGDFSIDYFTKNKLEKIGVKFREYNGSQSLIFWPEKAKLDNIKSKWMDIMNILPDKGILTTPSMSPNAIMFRRKYIPEDPHLQRQRFFERLKYSIQKKSENDIRKRKAKNSHPNKIELILGLFIEEIEPQVRQAIVKLNKKGYSTDTAGFMDNSCDQMIEGDFQLEEDTINKLKKVGVTVETNPSGYTRLYFSPKEANISKINKEWNKIASIFPEKNKAASSSMTRKAREFRAKYL
ncbi:hypothetical protein HY029_05150 [Candidatus Gottesmanbacteria bacterium]|nr:hypothetical protein [Candidatus Gottesmanbacteria bacterium]